MDVRFMKSSTPRPEEKRAERAVGDDQRALEPLLQQVRSDLLARAGAETDRGGE